MTNVQQGDLIFLKRNDTGAILTAVVNEIYFSSKETVLLELHFQDKDFSHKFVKLKEIEIIKVYREVVERTTFESEE